MSCFGRSGKCTRKSRFSHFFKSQQQFDKDVASGKAKKEWHGASEEPRDPNRVDYNQTGVHEMDEKEFKWFVPEHDICLVLFYEKNGEENAIAKEAFLKAASVTNRPYSTFAQVNCGKNPKLCNQEGATTVPYYRMYSKGAPVGSIRDYLTFPSQTMQAFVENGPILTQAPRPNPLSNLFKSRK
ncbi:hypothetical protein BsWGS_20574 [Bradybaena similaris]